MRFVPFVMILVGMIIGVAFPASAITNGSVDGDDHPQVGALIGDAPESDGTWAYCTGTLISPTVLLTAAHCGGSGQRTARVSFADRYEPGAKVFSGRFVRDPRYARGHHLHDMAVVVFPSAVPAIRPARLPAPGLLDRMRDDGTLQSTRFTPVGYGALTPTKKKQGWRFTYTDTRNRTSISFERLGADWLKLTPDSERGDGGTCFGDSGGPNFLGAADSDLLVATTISGADDACRSTNIDYRLDTSSAREFLRWFVTLP